jgi:hypothetical protein
VHAGALGHGLHRQPGIPGAQQFGDGGLQDGGADAGAAAPAGADEPAVAPWRRRLASGLLAVVTVDGALTVLLVAAYLLTRAWTAWRPTRAST